MQRKIYLCMYWNRWISLTEEIKNKFWTSGAYNWVGQFKINSHFKTVLQKV